jgi:hypothetical protein
MMITSEVRLNADERDDVKHWLMQPIESCSIKQKWTIHNLRYR